LVIDGLRILDVLVGLKNFATHFLDEVLFQDMAHIDDFPLLGNAHVVLGILFSCVVHRPFYVTRIILPYSSFVFLLTNFDRRVMQVC
jgi:hypothetical protein